MGQQNKDIYDLAFLLHSDTLSTFLNCEALNYTQYSRWGCTNIEYSGTITSFAQLVMLCLMHPMIQVALLAARAHTADSYWDAVDQNPHIPSAELLSSHSSTSLYFCPVLLHLRCRIQHLYLLNFMPLIFGISTNCCWSFMYYLE